MAHRVAWELSRGPIEPVELTIGHRCRRKECQNPNHMELLTRQENGHRGQQLSLAWLEPRWAISRKERAEREAETVRRRAERCARRSSESSPRAPTLRRTKLR